MDSIFVPFLKQLLGQAPSLLAYVVGIVFALLFWRRCPRPAMLILIAMAVLLLTTIAHSYLFLYLVRARADFDWSHEKLSWMLSAIGVIGSAVRAAAVGLMLTAAFIGRKAAWQATPPPAASALKQ